MNIKNICAAGLMVATSFTANTAFAEGNGGNYYVQLGGGASFGSKPGSDIIDKKMGTSGLINAEVGYKFNDSMRLGLGVDYRTGYKFKQSTAETVAQAGGSNIDQMHDYEYKARSLSAMVNLYYDFNAGSVVMPYVTVGTGVSHNEGKGCIKSWLVKTTTGQKSRVQTEAEKRKATYSFAYKAGLGARVAVAENVKLDTRYQFASLGRLKAGEQKGKIRVHELLVGISFQV
jgi:opacity protein-like surface antigen